MLDGGKAFSGFAVPDVKQAKAFYTETLGLNVSEEDAILHLQVGGGNDVIIYEKPDYTPATFTVLNFKVDDVSKAMDELTGRGVRFEIYDSGPVPTDERGVFRAEGMESAWFKDPAGNILSIMRFDD